MRGISKLCVLMLALAGGCRDKHVISVERLEAMSKINVLYVGIAEPYRLETKGGRSSLSRLVRGGAYYSVDLSRVKTSAKRVEEGGSITITLPQPMVEPFPDPTRSVEFNPRTGFLVNDSGLNRIREMYDEKDREKIVAAAGREEYMRMAKEQAEKILRDMLPELKVEIVWE